MPRSARAVTLTDVARLAGVSVATASKALNGRDEVAPATRERVHAAAERLSFTPNPLAQGLLAGRTGTVGLLTNDLEGRFVIPILMGAEDSFVAGQVNVFLCDARGDSVREQHQLRALLSRRVDGLIVVGRQTDPRPSLGRDLPVPVVYAYAPSDDPRRSLADSGQRRSRSHGGPAPAGQRAAAHHPHQRRPGVRRGSGPRARASTRHSPRPGSSCSPRSSASGPSRGGGTPPPCSCNSIRRPTPSSAGRTRSPGACSTQPGTWAARCPEDLAVMGFDNWEVLDDQLPAAAHQHRRQSAAARRIAAQRVFAALDGVDIGAGTQTLPGRLVIRGSTLERR